MGASQQIHYFTDHRNVVREVVDSGNAHEIVNVGLDVSPDNNVEEEEEEPGYHTSYEG